MRRSSPSPGAGSRRMSARRMAAGPRYSNRRRPSGSASGSFRRSNVGAVSRFAASRLRLCATLPPVGLVELGDFAKAHQVAEFGEFVERRVVADTGAVLFQVAIDLLQRGPRRQKAEAGKDRNRIADF